MPLDAPVTTATAPSSATCAPRGPGTPSALMPAVLLSLPPTLPCSSGGYRTSSCKALAPGRAQAGRCRAADDAPVGAAVGPRPGRDRIPDARGAAVPVP